MHPYRHDDTQPQTERYTPSRGLTLPGADGRVVVTWLLLAVNIGVWLLMQLAGGSTNSDVLLRFGAMFGPLIAAGEYWRMFTAMFLHVGVLHLFFNCFGLLIFGRLVEGVYGNLRFSLIYVLAGLSGSALSYMFNKTAIAAGASGAIFGILGALAAYLLVHRSALGDMGRRNLTSLAMIAALNLGIGLIIPNIDNWAHLGGLVGGFLMGLALAPRYRYFILGTSLGTERRIVGKMPLRARWLAVPAFAAALAALVWFGGLNLSDAEQSQLLVVRAEQSLQNDEPEAALQHVESAIELDPRSGPALFMRGKVMAHIGATDSAKTDLSASLRLEGLSPNQRAEAISLIVSLP